MMVVMKTKSVCFYNNKIKDNEKLMLVLLNCTLLHKKMMDRYELIKSNVSVYNL